MAEMRVKAITSIPGWSNLFQANEINSAAEAYAYVPLVFRAVKLRCNALRKVPYAITDLAGNEAKWPFTTPLSTLIWRTEAAKLLAGAAYWEIVRNVAKKDKNVIWRNPFDIEVEYKSQTGKNGLAEHLLYFKQGALSDPKWTNNLTTGDYEMVYFQEFHPLDDMKPGIASADVALNDSKMMRYISRFASIFFEQGAMPVMLLPFENIVPTEAAKVESFFKRQASGIANAFRTLAFRGKVTPTFVTPPLEQMVMPELYQQARQNVADGFEIPLPLLENPANRSVTEELRLSFFQDTVEPSGMDFEDTINTQLLNPLKLQFNFLFNELDIYQEDEEDRSGSMVDMVSVMEDIDKFRAAAAILGVEIPEDVEKMLNKIQAKQEEENERKEAQAAVFASNLAGANGNQPPQAQPQESQETTNMRADLERWQRKALKALKAGKLAAVPFESDYIPVEVDALVDTALAACDTPEAVKAAFASAIKEYAAPSPFYPGSLTTLIEELREIRALAE